MPVKGYSNLIYRFQVENWEFLFIYIIDMNATLSMLLTIDAMVCKNQDIHSTTEKIAIH